ncbi:MAG TPA: hypothetical protein VID95_09135 [Candidatus Limnocylindrales bacterium]|jgi:hypothetical protein
MVPSNGVARAAAEPPAVDAEALEFVRFCHRRKHVGWPELYDEMCLVAGRGLYRGFHAEDLSEIGVAFGLLDMPALAALVSRVVAEDQERRRRAAETIPTALVVEAAQPAEEPATDAVAVLPVPVMAPLAPTLTGRPDPVERTGPDHGSIRIAAAAGA